MSESPLAGKPVAQIAILVRDIEAASERFAKILGRPIPIPMTTQPGGEVHQTFRGQPSQAQAKLAFIDMGNLQLELIQPMGGDSVWQEALDKNGESVHHIAFWVEGLDSVASFLDQNGAPMVQRGNMGGGGQFAYFESEKILGVALELLEKG